MIDRFRIEIIIVMAGITVGPEPPELPESRTCMAAFAFQCNVGAQKREAVRMPAYIPRDTFPAANCVASRAVGTETAAMDIGVAVGALCSNVWKHQT